MSLLGRKTTAKRLQWALLVGIFMAAAPQLHSAGITPGTYTVTGEGHGQEDECGQRFGPVILCEGPIPFTLWDLSGMIQWDGGLVSGPTPISSLDGTSLFGIRTFTPPNWSRGGDPSFNAQLGGLEAQFLFLDADAGGALTGFTWWLDGMASLVMRVEFETPQSGTWRFGGMDWDSGLVTGTFELARIPEPGTLLLLGAALGLLRAMRRSRP